MTINILKYKQNYEIIFKKWFLESCKNVHRHNISNNDI